MTTREDDRRDEHGQWHLDRKVPISIIAVLVAQMLGWAYMAAKLEARVESLERTDIRHERVIDALEIDRQGSKDRLTRLEEVQRQMVDLLRRLDEKLDRITPPAGPR